LGRSDRFRAQALVEENRRGSAALLKVVEDPDSFSGYLNSVLLTLLAAQVFVATSVAYILLQELHGAWVVLGVVVEVLVMFVLTEAVPKTWAVQHTESASLVCAPVIATLSRVLPMRFVSRPLIWVANLLLPGKGLRQGPFVYEQQILALADTAAQE